MRLSLDGLRLSGSLLWYALTMVDKNYSRYMPKCVMITGATGGFGEAFARRFAATGAKLILQGLNLEKLKDPST